MNVNEFAAALKNNSKVIIIYIYYCYVFYAMSLIETCRFMDQLCIEGEGDLVANF